MSAGQTWVWLAALALHFSLVAAVSLQDFSVSLLLGSDRGPAWLRTGSEQIRAITAAALGKSLTESNPLRQVVTTYTDCSGIEAGYSYFAPSVPPNGKLSFEIRYPDGRTEYDLPPVGGAAAGYRIATLLDRLQNIHYVRLREAILQTLAAAAGREHPRAETIRARFAVANLPSIAEYRAGQRASYRTLYAYDFRLSPRPPPRATK